MRMEIPEQLPPNKPNFPLIVVLFVITIIVLLVGGLFVVHRAANHLPDGKTGHSERRLPTSSTAVC